MRDINPSCVRRCLCYQNRGSNPLTLFDNYWITYSDFVFIWGLQVGLQYLTGDIVGGNARCVAMLMALRSMIIDYETPLEKTLVRDLVTRTNNHVNFLISCRQV